MGLVRCVTPDWPAPPWVQAVTTERSARDPTDPYDGFNLAQHVDDEPGRVIQIGLRGSRFSEDDVKFSYDAGYHVVTMDEYEEMGRAAVIEKINSVLGDGRIYVSIDIDGLATYPGTMIGGGPPFMSSRVLAPKESVLRCRSTM